MLTFTHIVVTLILLLTILGALLFIAAQFMTKKISKKIKVRTKKLWIWRSFLVVLIGYMIFLVFTNLNIIREVFPGPMQIIPMVFLTIFFVSMIEIVAIDMLLPDVVSMWKRIAIELIGLLSLCGMAYFIFNTIAIPLLSTMFETV